MRFLAGQRVRIRGLPWEIVRAEGHDVIDVVGRAPRNRGERKRFLPAVERVEPAEAPPPAVPVPKGVVPEKIPVTPFPQVSAQERQVL